MSKRNHVFYKKLKKDKNNAINEYSNFDLEDDFDENEDATERWKQIQETTRKIGTAVVQLLPVEGGIFTELIHN